ncbi:MAG: hypothetical protein M5U26_26055 [Planctomycetota bacterium]|nr:hypothetical protein [Planctomycetota bacterium]
MARAFGWFLALVLALSAFPAIGGEPNPFLPREEEEEDAPAAEPKKTEKTPGRTATQDPKFLPFTPEGQAPGNEKQDGPKPAPQAAPAPAPAAVCESCKGTGYLPFRQPGVAWIQGEPIPGGRGPAPYQPCPKCKAGLDAAGLEADGQRRMNVAVSRHAGLRQESGLNFLLGQTRHVAVHSQLDANRTRAVLAALNAFTDLVQQSTGVTTLAQTRPDTHEIVVINDQASYSKWLDYLQKQQPGSDFSLAKGSGGMVGWKLSTFRSDKGTPPENCALHQFGWMLMEEATNGKAPAWLKEGFGAYAENAITRKNLMYTFHYEKNEVQFGQNWNEDAQKFAKEQKLKPWEYIFPLDLIGMKPLDYISCYSMTSFLIQANPKAFVDMLLKIRAGTDSKTAMEAAYKRKVPELQAAWGQWIFTQR